MAWHCTPQSINQIGLWLQTSRSHRWDLVPNYLQAPGRKRTTVTIVTWLLPGAAHCGAGRLRSGGHQKNISYYRSRLLSPLLSAKERIFVKTVLGRGQSVAICPCSAVPHDVIGRGAKYLKRHVCFIHASVARLVLLQRPFHHPRISIGQHRYKQHEFCQQTQSSGPGLRPGVDPRGSSWNLSFAQTLKLVCIARVGTRKICQRKFRMFLYPGPEVSVRSWPPIGA